MIGPSTPSGFFTFETETITLANRRFLIRRARDTDVHDLVSLLRDDALGAAREGSGAEEVADYQRAFGLIDSDPNQLLVTIADVTNCSEAYHDGSETHHDGSENHDEGGQAQPSDTESAAVVGTLQLTLIPSLSRRGSTRLQIEAVRIGPDAQGLGLGTAVFEWAHDCGRRFGASLAQLTTDKSRTDAQRFYARLGYEASHEGLKLDLS
ncbi:GNAT family N-acetyltransferase [Brevibacterium sp. UCMA 11752]|uniref:GNAT family N-acetyltransferase n=1 Tax=Brevibacterium sp. UCMA 11752 TaxID=2745946 RepID=UPI001F1CEE8D|nr:GNAT family N-acetyltransferase [Brevibacterium sp. UCMA 11752]